MSVAAMTGFTDQKLSNGDSAPDFKLPGVDGQDYNLADYRGQVKALVVAFWCNHCPYVIKSEDKLISLNQAYAGQEVQILLICSNDPVQYPQDNFKNMKRRAEEKDYPFPYLQDEDQTIAKAYGALVTPHIFLFDGDLKLSYQGSLDDNINLEDRPTVPYLKNAIDTLLANNVIGIEQSRTAPVGCSVKWK